MRPFVSLRRPADFDRLRRRGRRTVTDAFTLYRADPQAGDRVAVLGISVSKAVGIAVVRNRVRRRLAAIAAGELAGRPPARFLVVVRPPAAAMPFAQLEDRMRRALA